MEALDLNLGMDRLREIAAGKIPEVVGKPEILEKSGQEEIEICGHREWVEADTVYMVCGLPKHKGQRHGNWIREEPA